MDVVKGLQDTWDGIFAELAIAAANDAWDRPTANADWNVRDLAAHLAGTESSFQGFEQPKPGPDWSTDKQGIDQFTAASVAARSMWSHEQVIDEARRAADAQLARLRSLDDDGWNAETIGPLGKTTRRGLAEIRLFDLHIHLMDLRGALGRPLAPEREPDGVECDVKRAVDLLGWGATKKAALANGTRVRVELTGVGGRSMDVEVIDGKGRVGEAAAGEPNGGYIRGTALAFALAVSGRSSLVAPAGGIEATGAAAHQLLERYRFFQ